MRPILVLLAMGLLTFGAAGCGSGRGGGTGGGASSTGSTTGPSDAVISVTGRAAKGAIVRYGNDSGTFLGRVPLHESLGLDPRAGFYVVFVQLENGGNVTCKVTIGDATSVGHASGGRKSCLAKLTNRYNGTWYPSR